MITSLVNSTSTALGANEEFIGEAERNDFSCIIFSCKSDVNGTIYVDFSTDFGENWDSTISFGIVGGSNSFHRLMKNNRTVRVRYVNGTTEQTYFRLEVDFGNFELINFPLSISLDENADAILTKNMSEETLVAEGKFSSRYIVNKFGANSDISTATTPEDIWNGGGLYTGFPIGGNAETVILTSSSDEDTQTSGAGAWTVRIFGLDDNYDLQEEDLVCAGTGGVTSVNTWRRVNRLKVLTAGSTGTNVGALTLKHTSTVANVFMVVPAMAGETHIAGYTIPAGYTGHLINIYGAFQDNTTTTGTVAIWIREFGGAYRLTEPFFIANSLSFNRNIYGGITLPEKTDLVMRVTAVSGNNVKVNGAFGLKMTKN